MIQDKFIAKIEGHGSLTVDWKKNSVKLNVHEGERLFEGILVGRKAEEAYWITPRICGVCPVAHNLASLKAIEAALGIEVTDTTVLLRRLMMAGQIIQSHMLHLYFLSLPDYLGIDSAIELAKKNPLVLNNALALKKVSDYIVYVVGGRSIHPTTTVAGGFLKMPTKQSLKKLAKEVDNMAEAALATVELCASLKYPEIETEIEFVSQVSDSELAEEFTVYGVSHIVSNLEGKHEIKQYKKIIEEEIRSYSTAKFGRYQGREMLVGALARLAVQPNGLSPQAKKYLTKVNFKNPYHNNLAQGIEILHFQQEAKQIIAQLLNLKLNSKIVQPSKNPPLKGIGAVEAPRGGLYHEIHLDQKGIITYANIITPTVQNLTSMEKSAKAVLEQTKNMTKKERERLLNMLVRAYDPCITCSVH